MKRLMAFVLTLALALSIMPAVSAAQFSDLKGHWAEQVMLEANKNGLLFGSNGKMDPNGKLTRAHIAAIVTRAFGATYEADMSSYTDVPSTAWYAKDMARAVGMGIMANRGMIKPNEPISRLETFLVLAAALNLDDADASALSSFSDAASVSEYAKGQLAAMAARGYVRGANGKLNPNSTITRAEFAALFAQIFNSIKSSGNISTSITGNILINGDNVNMDYCFIVGDVIIGDGVKTVNLNAVSVQGRILIRGGETAVNLSGSTNATEGIIVAKTNGEAQLFNKAAITTDGVIIRTPTRLNGNFTNVDVRANVNIVSGVVNRMEVNEIGVAVTNEIGAILNYLYVNKNDVTASGTGFSSIILGQGVTGTILNGYPLLSSIVTSTGGIY